MDCQFKFSAGSINHGNGKCVYARDKFNSAMHLRKYVRDKLNSSLHLWKYVKLWIHHTSRRSEVWTIMRPLHTLKQFSVVLAHHVCFPCTISFYYYNRTSFVIALYKTQLFVQTHQNIFWNFVWVLNFFVLYFLEDTTLTRRPNTGRS